MASPQFPETSGSRLSPQRMLRWVGFGAAGIASALLLAFLCLQVPFVQCVLLERAIGGAVSTYNFTARVEGAGGLWPWRMRAAQVSLDDSEGEFAQLTDVSLDLRPLALLGGHVVIDRLAVGEGSYMRQPIRPLRDDQPFRLPTFPSQFEPGFKITIADFSLGPITIVAGDAPVTVQGGGWIDLGTDGLTANLALDAGESGHANLRVLVDAAARRIEASIEVADPAGQWLAPLTPLAPGTPLSGHLRASGPQNAVAIEAATQWGEASIQSSGTANWGDALGLTMTGTLDNIAPAREREWAGARQSFSAAIEIARDGTIDISDASVTARAAEARLSGQLADEVDIVGRVTVTGPAAVADRFGLQALEIGDVALQASGPADEPTVVVTSQVRRLAVGGVALANAGIETRGQVTRRGRAVDMDVSIRAAEVSGTGLPPALSSSALAITANARADFDRARVDVEMLNANWGVLRLEGAGELAGEGPMRFEGALEADDLATLDPRLSGAGRITGTARRARRGGPLEIALESTTNSFSAVGNLADLIGETPRLAIEARVTSTLAELQTASLELAGVSAQLAGTYDRVRNSADLSGSYSMVDLAALSAGPAGEVTGDVNLGGNLTAPELTVTALSPALQSGGVVAQNVTLRLADTGHSGTLTITADVSDAPFNASLPYQRSGFDLSGDAAVSLAGLNAQGPVAIEGGVPRAEIQAAADDIAPLVRVLRAYGGTADTLEAHGALTANLSVTGREGSLSLALAGPSIAGIDVPARAGEITLNAALDLSGAPALDGRLTASDARFGPSRFSVVDAKAQGPLADLSASLSLRGPDADPFHLDIEATRREAGAGSEIDLVSVRGQSLDYRVELAEGGRLDVGPNGVELAPTNFNVRNLVTGREGTLGAEARLWAGTPYAALTVDNVPAGAFAVFGLPVDWTGDLNGFATLDARGGTQPLRVALAATGLTNDPDVALLDVRLTAEATGRAMTAELAVTDTATETPLLSARSEMPLVWRTGRFAPVVDWTAPVEGELRANAPFDRLWLFVPVDTMSVSGELTADVTLGGTLGTPIARGEARLAQGTLEHFRTGLLLRDAAGTLSFTEAGDLTADIRATDGNGGRARLQGTAHLPRDENWEVDGTLELENLLLARRDEMRAVASGDLRLAGTLAEARLEGDVTLDRMDAQIPNQLPPSVVDLPVVRVNGEETANAGASDGGGGQQLGLPIDLDVTVNVPRRAFVRGRGLDSEWAGTLQLGGTMRTPRINGVMSVVRGTFDLSRTRFDLTQGDIQFHGGDRIDPTVQVEARAPGPEFTSIIRASGRARQPTITITSDPVMPEETVMAQILFGKDPQELTAFELVQIAEASASLTGSGGFDLLGSARRATGLDVLSIGARETESGGQDVNVSVGRYVTPNVFLGARRGLEPGSGAVTVEMEVTDDISVDAEVRQDAEGSVGVDWSRDY